MRFLLDTNVISEAVKSAPSKSVMRMLKRYQKDVVTAAPVWHELQYGYHRLDPAPKKEIIGRFLEEVVRTNMAILPYDERAAEWHAHERAKLTLSGQTPSFVDGQIAAIAVVNGLILVTRNTGDFSRFRGLTTANWHRS